MRKLFLTLSVFVCASAISVNAQDDSEREKGTSTNAGQQILPKAGDIAIGIDATPFFKYVGNMFNNSENNDADGLFNGVDQTIYGKYFLKDNAAIRAKLMFNFGNSNTKTEVADKNHADQFVTNQDIEKNSEFLLSLGYEFRRGYGRLQGYAGPQVLIGLENSSREWKYGNDLSNNNQGSRIQKINAGNAFSFGVGGFVGVEYFIAPKISLGGEFGLGYLHYSQGKNKVVSQTWDSGRNSVETTTTETYPDSPSSAANFGTMTEGNIFVMFHF